MIEEWKDIEGYDNYMVSNFGRVKSNFNGKERILIPYIIRRTNYFQVSLSKNGKCKKFLVHRLVAEAFIHNADNKPQIDHINTDRSDNRVENLRWVTRAENMNNPLTIEKLSKTYKGRKGKLNNSSKTILQLDKNMLFIKKWDCARDIERCLGYSYQNISHNCRGKIKTAYGYIWKYYDIELYLESKLFKAFNIKNKMVA